MQNINHSYRSFPMGQRFCHKDGAEAPKDGGFSADFNEAQKPDAEAAARLALSKRKIARDARDARYHVFDDPKEFDRMKESVDSKNAVEAKIRQYFAKFRKAAGTSLSKNLPFDEIELKTLGYVDKAFYAVDSSVFSEDDNSATDGYSSRTQMMEAISWGVDLSTQLTAGADPNSLGEYMGDEILKRAEAIVGSLREDLGEEIATYLALAVAGALLGGCLGSVAGGFAAQGLVAGGLETGTWMAIPGIAGAAAAMGIYHANGPESYESIESKYYDTINELLPDISMEDFNRLTTAIRLKSERDGCSKAIEGYFMAMQEAIRTITFNGVRKLSPEEFREAIRKFNGA
jgi:hypothetical protein